MPTKATIYHNPRCSKSRASLAILEQHEIDLEILEYLKTPPTRSELKQVLKLLACTPRDLIRTGQSEYRENNLDNMQLSDDELIDAMITHPILIERPIVIRGDKAVIGRPPESVLSLL